MLCEWNLNNLEMFVCCWLNEIPVSLGLYDIISTSDTVKCLKSGEDLENSVQARGNIKVSQNTQKDE